MSTTTDGHFQIMYQDLVLEFLADLMTKTIDAVTPEAFQHAVQSYCDELSPWITLTDASTHFPTIFSLFEDCTINDARDVTMLQLSPEGEAFFRAWVRRQAVLTAAEQRTDREQAH